MISQINLIAKLSKQQSRWTRANIMIYRLTLPLIFIVQANSQYDDGLLKISIFSVFLSGNISLKIEFLFFIELYENVERIIIEKQNPKILIVISILDLRSLDRDAKAIMKKSLVDDKRSFADETISENNLLWGENLI